MTKKNGESLESCDVCYQTKCGPKCKFRKPLGHTDSTDDQIKSTLEQEAALGCHAKGRILAALSSLWKLFEKIP